MQIVHLLLICTILTIVRAKIKPTKKEKLSNHISDFITTSKNCYDHAELAVPILERIHDCVNDALNKYLSDDKLILLVSNITSKSACYSTINGLCQFLKSKNFGENLCQRDLNPDLIRSENSCIVYLEEISSLTFDAIQQLLSLLIERNDISSIRTLSEHLLYLRQLDLQALQKIVASDDFKFEDARTQLKEQLKLMQMQTFHGTNTIPLIDPDIKNTASDMESKTSSSFRRILHLQQQAKPFITETKVAPHVQSLRTDQSWDANKTLHGKTVY